VMAIF